MSERGEVPVEGGRALVAVYAFLGLAACARSAVQIATRFDEAPVAFLLSGFSGAVYVFAAVALARRGRRWWIAGTACCTLELIGVIVVGIWSLVSAASFPQATVWSDFGAGYGFVPLALPFLGLLRQRRRRDLIE